MKHNYRNARGRYAKRPQKELPFWIPFAIVFVLIGAGEYHKRAEASIVRYEKTQVKEITIIETTADSEHSRYHVLALDIAEAHGLDARLFASVVACESNFDPTIQSRHLYNFNDPERGIRAGERELSYGIAQIHVPDHDVTIQQAQDPDFALNWMADMWIKGNAHYWTCYNQMVE